MHIFNLNEEQISVSSLIDDLGWESLEDRRKSARCTLMFRVIRGLVAVPEELSPRSAPSHSRNLRLTTRNHLPHMRSKLDAHANSFIPRTSRDWNRLLPAALTADTIEGFKAAIQPLAR